MNVDRMLRRLRKPVLALVAAAGLVASGASGAASASAPVLPGRASLAPADHAQPAAVTQTGIAAPAAQPSAGGGQQHRFGGEGGPAQWHRAVPAGGRGTPFRVGAPAPGPETSTRLARFRTGRLSAPATAPPTFPF